MNNVFRSLLFALLIFPFSNAAALDFDELRVKCVVPLNLIKKGISAAIEDRLSFDYEKINVNIKLKQVEKLEREEIFIDDIVKKLRLKKKGALGFQLKGAPKVKYEKCKVDYNVTIKVKAKTLGGKTVQGEARTEFVSFPGVMQ